MYSTRVQSIHGRKMESFRMEKQKALQIELKLRQSSFLINLLILTSENKEFCTLLHYIVLKSLA